ncbi:hypothetical protein RRG08_006540 [Elysia crispata]|uniref:Uncharacterized protein n=1 Tax=Elysia crispata TaxID=231223 RepID=A0AAE1ATK0_9GAST|nr:hypothetical protein RRG08_006540 [Elysia crispata]
MTNSYIKPRVWLGRWGRVPLCQEWGWLDGRHLLNVKPCQDQGWLNGRHRLYAKPRSGLVKWEASTLRQAKTMVG